MFLYFYIFVVIEAVLSLWQQFCHAHLITVLCYGLSPLFFIKFVSNLT